MNEHHAVGWLHRRAGFGLHPDDLAAATVRGARAELAAITAPPNDRTDPWDGLALDPQDGGRGEAVFAWLDAMRRSTHPFHDRRTLFLHGWLVSSLGKVARPELMVEQIRLFADTGGGSYPDLLRAITTNRAMLVYLDGRTSTAEAPNENYGRELLELFALGVGHYTEADVQAAARALTGWVVGPQLDRAVFVARRHDDTPQRLLAAADVDDVDSVVDAIVANDRHPTFVARRVMHDYLGDVTGELRDTITDDLRSVYLANDRRLDPVIVRALEIGIESIDGDRSALPSTVLAPIPWMIACLRATDVSLLALRRDGNGAVRDMGQIPLLPPSVVGWPSDVEWLTSSALVARTRVATTIAASTDPDQPLAVALADDDLDAVARHLGLSREFGEATVAAVDSTTDPDARLALVLVSPENLLA